MANTILSIIGSVLLIVIGAWKYFGEKNNEKKKNAEKAKKELDNAIKNDSPSDFLDCFGRL